MPSTADAVLRRRRALGATGLLRRVQRRRRARRRRRPRRPPPRRPAGEADDAVLLACALAVRAPRLGHVHVDLADDPRHARPSSPTATRSPSTSRRCPGPGTTGSPRRRLAASSPTARCTSRARALPRPLLAGGDAGSPPTCARSASRWRRRGTARPTGSARLFDDAPRGARRGKAALPQPAGRSSPAARAPARRPRSPASSRCSSSRTADPLVALAAPTGKAQARLQEAIAEAAAGLDVSAGRPRAHPRPAQPRPCTACSAGGPTAAAASATTAASACRTTSSSSTRPRWCRCRMMARLVEAIRPDARLILVGDPGQLASVEAGAVLGDVVGARRGGSLQSSLERVHRHGGAIAALAAAIRAGDADAAMALLRGRARRRRLAAGGRADLREPALAAARAVRAAAAAGDRVARSPPCPASASSAPTAARSPPGRERIEDWLGVDPRDGASRPGARCSSPPTTTTLGLYNGDTGVIVAERRAPARRLRARRHRQPRPPVRRRHRLRDDRPQGAGLAVPHRRRRPARPRLAHPHPRAALHRRHPRPGPPDRRGTEDAVRAAIARPIARASGLRARLETS